MKTGLALREVRKSGFLPIEIDPPRRLQGEKPFSLRRARMRALPAR
jgi:hypothetical protein